MTCVYCSLAEQYVNPLFEVFDGGDFVLSSSRDVEDDATEMAIYFEEADRADEAKRLLSDAMALVGAEAEIRVRDVPDEDWKFSYRRHFKTEVISPRLAIVPEWEEFKPAEGQQVVKLDPGLAFGTGKHETTKTCLKFIDQLASDGSVDPATAAFLDVGTGSGILSIAARKLGFADVRGFDLDPEAVTVANESAALNGVSIPFFRGDLSGIMPGNPAIAPGDVVAANVLGPVLIRFADQVSALVKPGGRIILSGILETLYAEVKAAYEARGFRELAATTLGEWRTGLFAR